MIVIAYRRDAVEGIVIPGAFAQFLGVPSSSSIHPMFSIS